MKHKNLKLILLPFVLASCSSNNPTSSVGSSNSIESTSTNSFSNVENSSQESSLVESFSSNSETSLSSTNSNTQLVSSKSENSQANVESSNNPNQSSTSLPDIKPGQGNHNPNKFEKYDYTYSNETTLKGTMVNSSLKNLSAEGYATNVTGGGLLDESSKDYYKVTNAYEFINAISRKNNENKSDTDFAIRPTVIEVVNDIDLGWNNLDAKTQGLADVVKANDPQTHPILKQTGVSIVYITGRQNLTIFSKNGARLSHACFQIRGFDTEKRASKNIMIRNLEFDGIYEWDDSGKYDNNDWDQFTIRADKGEVSNIWIDHCTFKKTYDGTIDIKYGATDITISWCAFVPYTKNDLEFMTMMNHLEQNRTSFPNYNQARNSGATFEDLIQYASINKKVHLVGHTDNNPGDENIRVTYCNNYYLDCVERLPRLRMGKVHVYNNIFDASSTEDLKLKVKSLSSWPKSLSFSENGSQGTNKGKLLMENCYINGINCPLRNCMKGTDISNAGAVEALYTYYTCENISRTWDKSSVTQTDVFYTGRYTFKGHSVNGENENLLRPFPMAPLQFNTHQFKTELNYSYILYEPETLYITQNNKVGAKAINFTAEQWKKSHYGENEMVNDLILPNTGVDGLSSNLNLNRI